MLSDRIVISYVNLADAVDSRRQELVLERRARKFVVVQVQMHSRRSQGQAQFASCGTQYFRQTQRGSDRSSKTIDKCLTRRRHFCFLIELGLADGDPRLVGDRLGECDIGVAPVAQYFSSR